MIYNSLIALKAEILLGNKNYSPHNSLSRCCCYLFIWYNLLKTPWCHLQSQAPQSISKLSYSLPECLKPFKSTLLPIFKIIQHELPSIDQQLGIFSTVWSKLCAWLNLLNLGASDIRVAQLKPRDFHIFEVLTKLVKFKDQCCWTLTSAG